MPDIPSASGVRRSRIRFAKGIGLALALVVLNACDRTENPNETINLKIYQNWQLQPGDKIAGFPVVSGLGDVSIELNGKSVYAPYDGQAQKDQRNCLIFSSPSVPAYLFRLCGISNPRLGSSNQGDSLGSGDVLHFATLRKQPDGTWAIVEPSKPMIERILTKS
ncbi:hypothetical protein JOY44_11880 [Phormidium sp. CLA17]|uniref:hypothetical protein n=1 Tax=Leptolyngbya sp. Cla-17 TaxID=2803751 RepID=UPI0018D76D0B|nr:hypothetical protein [Leptolyngbya sp. Cla-17]MBM0742310.1 hypothetical protein [Leptolyngbya sp. Cla-17]